VPELAQWLGPGGQLRGERFQLSRRGLDRTWQQEELSGHEPLGRDGPTRLRVLFKDRHFRGRLEKIVGPHVRSGETDGRVYFFGIGLTPVQLRATLLFPTRRTAHLVYRATIVLPKTRKTVNRAVARCILF